MIKNRNIDPNAAIEMSKILGPGQVGETFWLAGVDTQEYEILRDRVDSDKLFVDSTEAINAMTSAQGDVLYVAPNYAEVIAAAAGLVIDKTGIEIRCLGIGAARPTFTFSATASTITITAASVKMTNFIIVPSIDSVVSPLVVSAADCTLQYEVQDASASIECVNSLLTTAAADRLTVDCKYVGFTAGNACVNAIRLVGVDTARINVDFYGVASTSIVEFHTTACTNVIVTGSFYNHGTTDLSKNVVDTQGSSTWAVIGLDVAAGSNFSGGSVLAVANSFVAAMKGLRIAVAAADVLDGTTTSLYTIAGGRVIVTGIYGVVSGAAVDAAANTFKFQANPTTGTTTDMSAASADLTGKEVGTQLSISGTAATGTQVGASGSVIGQATEVIVAIGAIECVSSADAGTGGAVVGFELFYLPLDAGATVTAT